VKSPKRSTSQKTRDPERKFGKAGGSARPTRSSAERSERRDGGERKSDKPRSKSGTKSAGGFRQGEARGQDKPREKRGAANRGNFTRDGDLRAERTAGKRGGQTGRPLKREGGTRLQRGAERTERTQRSAERTERFQRGAERTERSQRGGERTERTERFQRGGERTERSQRGGERAERGAGTGERGARFQRAGERPARSGEGAERGQRSKGARVHAKPRVMDPERFQRSGGGRSQRQGERSRENPRDKAAREAARDKRGAASFEDKPRGKSAGLSFLQPAASGSKRLGAERKARPGKHPKPATRELSGSEPAGEAEPTRPQRAAYPTTPVALSTVSGEPHPGQWIFTTREGSEQDLVDELLLGKVIEPGPRVLAPSLVLSPKVPKREKRPIELAFARQGFEILNNVRTSDLDELALRLERSIRNKLQRASVYALHVWVPDTNETNALSSMAEDLENRVAQRLAQQLPDAKRVDDGTLRRLGSIPFAQICLIARDHAVAGVMHSNSVPSLARGGRTRIRLTGDFPSRAARKLEEALAWIGVEPGPGEVCVDLGAAPGGWTYVLAERRARVIAVDPAKLRPEVLAKKGVRHLQDSAFTYQPDEMIDWLFCDMAWRPLEAAALLAKWGRRRWARMVVANIKLPMKKKAEILARVRTILESEGEWKGLRFKQLYHDREEITLTAHTG
jgi:23S rRNA (cytidine2498-2'-O)-methyltransferase